MIGCPGLARPEFNYSSTTFANNAVGTCLVPHRDFSWRTPKASAVTHSSPKILVVDDDPNITRALWRRFRSVGIEVIQSHHGKEGMFLAMKERPDVIITDFKMPGISGERLLMNLKCNDVTKNIPVIMITGVTFGGSEDYALKRQVLGRGGAVSFMNKPLDFEALLMELRRHIRLPQQGDTPGPYDSPEDS